MEKLITFKNMKKEFWYITGYCQACDKKSTFLLDWKYSNRLVPNFRERLVCKHCNLNNRQRFTFSYLKSVISKQHYSNVFMFEQVTNFYKLAKENLSISVSGSEYLGPEYLSGEIVNGIRHEDALKLSFNDQSFDVIVSNDVFEHVPDIHKAIKETYRVLKDNGLLIFTIPFYSSNEKTMQRSTIENGKIVHKLEAQYHGNPVSNNGSLVFYDFGWDILDIFRCNGFTDCYMLTFYNFHYGYLGNGLQFIFVAKK